MTQAPQSEVGLQWPQAEFIEKLLVVCVCVSQTLFQREVNLCLESVHDVHAGGHRKPIELCPTKLSMVSSGYQG